MKKIIHIARNELHSLIYSPLAWVFMVVMLYFTATGYAGLLAGAVGYYQQGGYSLLPRGAGNFSGWLTFNLPAGFIQDLYLYLPLITMAIVSREMGGGTIKLLYSSPVRIRQIVLGKYLGLFTLLAIYMFFLLLMVIGYCMVLKNPDYTLLISVYLSYFLVACAIAAIGLFISSLTSYQIVAAIITFIVLTFFKRATWYWQDVEWFRIVSTYIDFGRKSEKIFMGRFSLADITYYFVIIISFLSFTIFRLKAMVSRTSVFIKAGRYVAVTVIAIIIIVIVNNPYVNKYFDATRDKRLTITENMQQWIKKLDKGPLEITVFANVICDELDGLGYSPRFKYRGVDDVFEGIVRFKPDTKLKIVYYYDIDSGNAVFKEFRGLTLRQIAARRADAFSIDMKDVLTPGEVNKIIDVKKEDYGNFFLYKYQGRTATSRIFDDVDLLYRGRFPNDEHYAAIFSRLLGIKMPTLLFLSDELERIPYSKQLRDYRKFTLDPGFNKSLGNRGFNIDTLSLHRQDIPDSITALIIADPRTPFSLESLAKIKGYIAGGGNLLITGEADRKEVLQPVLDELGISFRPGILIQPSEKYASHRIFAHLTDTAQHISAQFSRITNDMREREGAVAFPVAMEGAASLQTIPTNGFEYIPLITTNPSESWNRVAPIIEDSLQVPVPRRNDDENGTFVTAYLLKRMIHGKEQRIVVTGDADYLTRPLAHWRLNVLNFEYNLGIFNVFTYGQFPANVTWPRATDNAFTIKVADTDIQKIIFVYIIPVLLIIGGSVVLIRRKRK